MHRRTGLILQTAVAEQHQHDITLARQQIKDLPLGTVCLADLGYQGRVSAFSTANGVVLGQVKTDEKSNEITAIPALLKLLSVCGCLVTLDAMGCQKQIAQAILDKEADYLLAVKGNQKRLEDAFEKHFPLHHFVNYQGDHFTTQERAHGREESRFHSVSDIIGDFIELSINWPRLKTLGVAVSFRSDKDEIPENATVRYYISSATLTARQFAEAIRNHWFIENQFHWRLDAR